MAVTHLCEACKRNEIDVVKFLMNQLSLIDYAMIVTGGS